MSGKRRTNKSFLYQHKSVIWVQLPCLTAALLVKLCNIALWWLYVRQSKLISLTSKGERSHPDFLSPSALSLVFLESLTESGSSLTRQRNIKKLAKFCQNQTKEGVMVPSPGFGGQGRVRDFHCYEFSCPIWPCLEIVFCWIDKKSSLPVRWAHGVGGLEMNGLNITGAGKWWIISSSFFVVYPVGFISL